MKITRIETIHEDELLTRFKQTRLRGHGQPLVYENANLTLQRQVDPRSLYPAQNYILHDDHQRLLDLYHLFQKQGFNIFSMPGGLLFWLESGHDLQEEEGPIPLTPPIVEMSRELDGRVVPLINDGMHRVYTAMQLQQSIDIILVDHVPEQWPYYAHARKTGWQGVEQLQALPDGFVKKSYRDPNHYKDLFRDFNYIFPGIQKQRKRSNPNNLSA